MERNGFIIGISLLIRSAVHSMLSPAVSGPFCRTCPPKSRSFIFHSIIACALECSLYIMLYSTVYSIITLRFFIVPRLLFLKVKHTVLTHESISRDVIRVLCICSSPSTFAIVGSVASVLPVHLRQIRILDYMLIRHGYDAGMACSMVKN